MAFDLNKASCRVRVTLVMIRSAQVQCWHGGAVHGAYSHVCTQLSTAHSQPLLAPQHAFAHSQRFDAPDKPRRKRVVLHYYHVTTTVALTLTRAQNFCDEVTCNPGGLQCPKPTTRPAIEHRAHYGATTVVHQGHSLTSRSISPAFTCPAKVSSYARARTCSSAAS